MWAHPRSRGEHNLRTPSKLFRSGSSPLARGTLALPPRRRPLRGLIPARAGNTSSRTRLLRPVRAHPRSRGEHLLGGVVKACVVGSSPLARGTHREGCYPARAGGLIPARAGNTPQHVMTRVEGWAHPRSRGEHVESKPPPVTSPGSSPLARGTPGTSTNRSRNGGLIPARAGNTEGLR